MPFGAFVPSSLQSPHDLPYRRWFGRLPIRLGQSIRHQIQELGQDLGEIRTVRISRIQLPNDVSADDSSASRELLADPIVEEAQIVSRRMSSEAQPDRNSPKARRDGPGGGLDRDGDSRHGARVKEVRTGRAFVLDRKVERAELQRIASRVLANGVIESVHFDTFLPKHSQRGMTTHSSCGMCDARAE